MKNRYHLIITKDSIYKLYELKRDGSVEKIATGPDAILKHNENKNVTKVTDYRKD